MGSACIRLSIWIVTCMCTIGFAISMYSSLRSLSITAQCFVQ